jgi:hypothetical protein
MNTLVCQKQLCKMVNADSPGRFAKDIFLILLLGENNKPRLEYSKIENTKALYRVLFYANIFFYSFASFIHFRFF